MYIADFFKNTGFDAVNRPYSPNLLYDKNQFPLSDRIQCRDVNLVQDGWIGKLRVRTNELSVEDARGCDYVVIYDEDDEEEGGYEWLNRASCYTIRDFKELGGTIELTLLYDAFCSMGGFEPGSGNTITGSANRMTIPISHYKDSQGQEHLGYFHKNDSVEFFTLEEPFIPSDRLYTGFHDIPVTPAVPVPPTPPAEVKDKALSMNGQAYYSNSIGDKTNYKFKNWYRYIDSGSTIGNFVMGLYINKVADNTTTKFTKPGNLEANIHAQIDNHYVLYPDRYTTTDKAQIEYLYGEMVEDLNSVISQFNTMLKADKHCTMIYAVNIAPSGYYKYIIMHIDREGDVYTEQYGKQTYNGEWVSLNKEK